MRGFAQSWARAFPGVGGMRSARRGAVVARGAFDQVDDPDLICVRGSPAFRTTKAKHGEIDRVGDGPGLIAATGSPA
ncbi:hypothetical protein K7G98_37890, partial [Saccharothrix sp. MB29]|nr:hypothetical protein [Saccharothrix sp. MB29]